MTINLYCQTGGTTVLVRSIWPCGGPYSATAQSSVVQTDKSWSVPNGADPQSSKQLCTFARIWVLTDIKIFVFKLLCVLTFYVMTWSFVLFFKKILYILFWFILSPEKVVEIYCGCWLFIYVWSFILFKIFVQIYKIISYA
jgi:hypothetical protein